MVYQCEWPLYQSHHGINPNYTAIRSGHRLQKGYLKLLKNCREHCNLWRNNYDVQDNWNSVSSVIDFYGDNKDGFLEMAGPGGWNDPDMLVIGNFGLSLEQSRAQMTLWAMFAAPLIMSNDLRTLRPEFVEILQHRELLKIAQDPYGISGKRVTRRKHVDFFTRPVSPVMGAKHSQVVAIYNRWQEGGTPLEVKSFHELYLRILPPAPVSLLIFQGFICWSVCWNKGRGI